MGDEDQSARILELLFDRVGTALPLPGADELLEPLGNVDVKAERFACFTRSRLAAISDDVGAHRRAKLAVAFVDILDGSFTVISGRKIEIDVRSLAPYF